MSRISTWRLEKYFAKTNIKTIFIISAGWNENPLKLNQLCAPCEICPNAKRAKSIAEKKRNKNIRTFVRFKNLKSTEEKIKNIAKAIITKIICLLKKLSAFSDETKDFIVNKPANIIGTIKKTKSQSILNEILLKNPLFICYFNFTEKISYIGIISLATILLENGSGHVKFIFVFSSPSIFSK